jgi:hypothetical protein
MDNGASWQAGQLEYRKQLGCSLFGEIAKTFATSAADGRGLVIRPDMKLIARNLRYGSRTFVR